jgi:ADP-ribosylglycohydrolase
MKENARVMVLGSFLADSLSLGVHWIYDVNRIKKEFGRVENLLKPLPDSYHPTKDRGEFTHYGDQMLVLLESVSAKGRFDLATPRRCETCGLYVTMKQGL